MLIRNMRRTDWETVSAIYAKGIATGMATFETASPSYEAWNKNHLKQCRLVAESDGKVWGWASLSPVSGRCVYGGVAELSVYVDPNKSGQGIGQLLVKQLIKESESAGFWTLQSGIFPENTASIALHEKLGFRYLGKRERIAKYNGVWKDNLVYERRSKIVGLN